MNDLSARLDSKGFVSRSFIQLYYLMTVAKLEQLCYLAWWISGWIVDGIGVPYSERSR